MARLVASVPGELPDGYLAFLRQSNGGEGYVGERYVSLWAAEEVDHWNAAYQIYPYLPGVVAIGTDGDDYSYLFDQRVATPDPPVLVAELGNLALGFAAASLVASSFAALMRRC